MKLPDFWVDKIEGVESCHVSSCAGEIKEKLKGNN